MSEFSLSPLSRPPLSGARQVASTSLCARLERPCSPNGSSRNTASRVRAVLDCWRWGGGQEECKQGRGGGDAKEMHACKSGEADAEKTEEGGSMEVEKDLQTSSFSIASSMKETSILSLTLSLQQTIQLFGWLLLVLVRGCFACFSVENGPPAFFSFLH